MLRLASPSAEYKSGISFSEGFCRYAVVIKITGLFFFYDLCFFHILLYMDSCEGIDSFYFFRNPFVWPNYRENDFI
jgi:hypothetical protein